MIRRFRLVDAEDGVERPLKGGHMRVAFATQDRANVDAHFASARNFLFYDIGPDGHSFIEAVEFDTVSQQDGNHSEDGEDRLLAKIEALSGSALLFVRAIGGPAAARVVRAHVHPIKLPGDEPIPVVIERVRTMLNSNPPPWLRRAVESRAAGPERFIDDED